MCGTCGCGHDEGITITLIGEELESARSHQHGHGHGHLHHQHGNGHHHHHHDEHGHSHKHAHTTLEVEQDILRENELTAARMRGYFEAKNILAVNLVSSPGSGKTSLLEKSLKRLSAIRPVQVIEGDQQTSKDADRIASTGAPVVQVNTGNGCHLDAEMVKRAVDKLRPKEGSMLFIENVGNLVCPSLFDLGEGKRVVIMSVTEGDDKPIKYPNMFATADLCIINKMDLLPYVDFDLERAKNYALQVNPALHFIELSVTGGQGLDEWIEWLETQLLNLNE